MKIRDSYRVVILGDGSVGKTSIVTQFIDGYFNPKYKPTIEDFHTHTVQLKNGYDHNVQIIDTAGTHKFPAMRELSFRSGRGFILVFSLDSEASFNEAISIYKQILKARNDNDAPVVLVGNKSDLPRSIADQTIKIRKKNEMNDIPYIETSAKLDLNIQSVFQELLTITIDKENNLEKIRKQQTKQQQAQLKKARNQHLLRRLSTFGSLPNINLIRRKSNIVNNANNSSNSSISSDNSTSSKDAIKNTNKKIGLSNVVKPMFYSPMMKRKFNENLVKPQLSLDETKVRFNNNLKNLNQRFIHQKIFNTKSFDISSTTSSCGSSNSASSNDSTNSSIKGSKESLETKCHVM